MNTKGVIIEFKANFGFPLFRISFDFAFRYESNYFLKFSGMEAFKLFQRIQNKTAPGLNS